MKNTNTQQPFPDLIYNKTWKDELENRHGVIDKEKLMQILYDYTELQRKYDALVDDNTFNKDDYYEKFYLSYAIENCIKSTKATKDYDKLVDKLSYEFDLWDM